MVTVESLDHLPIKLGQRPRDPARGPLLGLETTFTDRNTGRKRLTHLPTGRYRVIARFPGLPDLEEEIQLGFGDERKVTFDFERQRKSLAEGSPKPGAAPR
jgi:hypothetical protein